MLTRREVFVMHLQIALEMSPVIVLAIVPMILMASGLCYLMNAGV